MGLPFSIPVLLGLQDVQYKDRPAVTKILAHFLEDSKLVHLFLWNKDVQDPPAPLSSPTPVFSSSAPFYQTLLAPHKVHQPQPIIPPGV